MKRPVTIIIAAGLLLLLVFISSVWPMVSGQHLSGVSDELNGSTPGQGNPPSGFQPEGTPPAQGEQPKEIQPQGTAMPDNSGGFKDKGGVGPATSLRENGSATTAPADSGRTRGSSPLNNPDQNRFLEYALYAIILMLGLVSFGGLWQWKRWGNITAIITSVFVLVVAIPSLSQIDSTIILVEILLKVVLAAGVIVLVLLPQSRPAPSLF